MFLYFLKVFQSAATLRKFGNRYFNFKKARFKNRLLFSFSELKPTALEKNSLHCKFGNRVVFLFFKQVLKIAFCGAFPSSSRQHLRKTRCIINLEIGWSFLFFKTSFKKAFCGAFPISSRQHL